MERLQTTHFVHSVSYMNIISIKLLCMHEYVSNTDCHCLKAVLMKF